MHWTINLGFLRFEGTQWEGKVIWWSSAVSTLMGAFYASLCSPETACNPGDSLAGVYVMMYGIVHLLDASRWMELERLSAGTHPAAMS